MVQVLNLTYEVQSLLNIGIIVFEIIGQFLNQWFVYFCNSPPEKAVDLLVGSWFWTAVNSVLHSNWRNWNNASFSWAIHQQHVLCKQLNQVLIHLVANGIKLNVLLMQKSTKHLWKADSFCLKVLHPSKEKWWQSIKSTLFFLSSSLRCRWWAVP
jgi:hypothetical protein